MMSGEHELLLKEARYLHRRMFNRYPADKLVDAYVRAHTEIDELHAVNPKQLKTVHTIIDRGLEPGGIEPWLRGNGIRHVLSAKMLLIAYLAECDACHPEFARHATDGRMALVHMSRTTLGAVFRLFHGYVQKAWHGLV